MRVGEWEMEGKVKVDKVKVKKGSGTGEGEGEWEMEGKVKVDKVKVKKGTGTGEGKGGWVKYALNYDMGKRFLLQVHLYQIYLVLECFFVKQAQTNTRNRKYCLILCEILTELFYLNILNRFYLEIETVSFLIITCFSNFARLIHKLH